MSRVYIISTHRFGADYPGRLSTISFLPEYIRLFSDEEWNSHFSQLDCIPQDSRFYYELPHQDDCKVFAVRELPIGRCDLISSWIDALSSYFLKDEDDEVCFILHDKDIIPYGRPYFYSFNYSGVRNGRRCRVFGFEHKRNDYIWKALCREYHTSRAFSMGIEPVLEVVLAKEILEDCLDNERYPAYQCKLVEERFHNDDCRNRYPDPSSEAYAEYLNRVRDGLLDSIGL